MASVGFSGDRIAYVPVSGLKGENLFGGVSSDHPLKLWYDGPSLLQAIDAFDPLVRPVEAALRFPVADFFRGGIDSSSGVSVSGRILQGHLQVGDTLAVLPGDAKGVVKSIEANHEASQWAVAGDSVVMTMGGLDILELRQLRLCES